MRVLLLSSETQTTLIRYFQNGFLDLGHDVKTFSVSPLAELKPMVSKKDASYVGVLQYRVLNRLITLKLPWVREKTLLDLKNIIEDFKPDFVLTVQGHNLDKEMLSLLQKFKLQIYNYYADPTPLYDEKFLKTIPFYSCIFTYNKDQIPRWYWFGAKEVFYLPFASDPHIHTPPSLSLEEKKLYESPVTYPATWQPYAEYWPEKLLQFGLKIWGNQWYKLPASSPLKKAWQGEGKGTGLYLPFVCAASDIVFNVVRAKNGNSHSMKTFEIPACGGFMLSNRTDDQIKFFPEDVAAVYFSTEEELLDKIRFYLKHEEKRKAIALKGLEIAQKHRYADRMQVIIDHYKQSRGD